MTSLHHKCIHSPFHTATRFTDGFCRYYRKKKKNSASEKSFYYSHCALTSLSGSENDCSHSYPCNSLRCPTIGMMQMWGQFSLHHIWVGDRRSTAYFSGRTDVDKANDKGHRTNHSSARQGCLRENVMECAPFQHSLCDSIKTKTSTRAGAIAEQRLLILFLFLQFSAFKYILIS